MSVVDRVNSGFSSLRKLNFYVVMLDVDLELSLLVIVAVMHVFLILELNIRSADR